MEDKNTYNITAFWTLKDVTWEELCEFVAEVQPSPPLDLEVEPV